MKTARSLAKSFCRNGKSGAPVGEPVVVKKRGRKDLERRDLRREWVMERR